jgi:serine/threonine protein kinase
VSTTRLLNKEDADIAFCQLAMKRGYLDERVFKECLVVHAAIKQMGLSKPGIRDIVMSKAKIRPEHVVELMAVLGARSGKKEIEGYSLIEKVASGAFGSIYRARQDSMDRVVALKVLPRRLAVNKLYVNNFMRETRLAAKLAHDNIVYVLDAGQSAGLLYLAMEFVEGQSLRDLVRTSGPQGEKRIFTVAWALAQALGHAHKTGILHRDVKPANVLIKHDGTPKLCDFGLAKSTARKAMMEVSGIIGTPSYMAPEQILGERPDETTDVYSLGATLYYMATGAPPFPAGTTLSEVYENQIKRPLSPLRDAYPGVSARVERLVMKMMHRRREQRFKTADEVADAVAQIARGD